MKLLLKIILVSIRAYQLTLSPDHGLVKIFFPGGACRYRPTCSEYMAQAVRQHGWSGIYLGVRRLVHCHPLGGSGYDPVPEK